MGNVYIILKHIYSGNGVYQLSLESPEFYRIYYKNILPLCLHYTFTSSWTDAVNISEVDFRLYGRQLEKSI